MDDGDVARQHSFHTILAVMNRMKEHMRRNSDVLQKMALKMHSLSEKGRKVGTSIFS